MSLQVWLPLNGSLENKGLSDLTFQVVNYNNAITSATSGGKTVPGLYKRTSRTADYIISNKNITLDGDVSMCCWAKVTGISDSGTANGLFGQHGHLTGGLGITMKDVSSTDLRMSINTGLYGDSHGSSNDRTFCTYYGSTNIYNEWHHLCLTYNSSTRQLQMYVDGNLETITGYGNYITLAGNSTVARPIILFAWSTDHLGSNIPYYRPPCELNDVRVYDHCLSPREVKLLAQGLVAHYKLDNGQPNLIKHGAETKSSSEYCVAKYAFDKTGFGRYLNPNEACTLTVCFTPHSNFGYWFPHLNQGAVGGWIYSPETTGKSDGTTNCQIVTMHSNSTWNYYERWDGPTVSPNDNLAEICMYAKNKDGLNNNGNVTIHWIKLEQGHQSQIKYFSPSLTENAALYNKEFDCSGYGNHLTKSGNTIAMYPSPRYGSAIDFNQTGYLYKTDFNLTTKQFTCAFWLKAPSTTTDQHFLFGTHNNWTNNGLSAWRDKNGPSYSVIIRSDAETGHSGFGFSFNANTWEHIVYTYTGTEVIGYRNGIEFNRSTYGKNGNVVLPVIYLGNSLYSNAPASEIDEAAMSDFRIYATALPAAAVKELYQSSISFLDNGTLQCSEIVESPTNLKYNQNGIVQANQLNEIGYVDKMKVKTLSDGSAWARIHWLDVTSAQTYFTEAETQECTTASNRFSLMKYVEYFKKNDGYYEFMLTHPKLSTTAYNRWKQTSSPNSGTVEGFSTIGGQAWGEANHGIRKHNGSNCVYNCDEGGTWYAPIGQFGAWNGGIPAANQSNTATTEIELWVRIDNLPKLTKLSMFDRALQVRQIYEL